MRALIIGGGIAGPLTGMALQRAGIEATVFEAYPQHAALGLARGSECIGALLLCLKQLGWMG
jgi:2-polyprenyl-6-methoxyphenol hydroxylase-like FAD-dependent oxidoreductase